MKIQTKELITLGIFSVIIISINIVIGLPTMFSPILIPIARCLCCLITGIPFMLYLTRAKQGELIWLMGLIMGVIMVLFGDYVLTLATGLLAGVIAAVFGVNRIQRRRRWRGDYQHGRHARGLCCGRIQGHMQAGDGTLRCDAI